MDNRLSISCELKIHMKRIIFTQLCLDIPTVTFAEDSWIIAVYFCVALQQMGGRHGLI